jgi:hypothetical protein
MKPHWNRVKIGATLFRVIRVLVVVLITVALLEVGSVGLYPVVFHKPFSRRDIQRELVLRQGPQSETAPVSPSDPVIVRNHIIHPYLGFVGNPGNYMADWEFSRNGQKSTINDYGFPGMSPILKRQNDSVTICILGGSFAMNFYLDSKDTLLDELKTRGVFRDKKINVVSVAMSGWKQPQQLLALSYFLSLGAKYDVVVNLDGFNELALPFLENRREGVYPFFPRLWNLYASRLLSERIILQSAESIRLRQKVQQQKRFFSSPLIRHSNFCLFLFEVLARNVQNQIATATNTLQTMLNQKDQIHSFENSGPQTFEYGDGDRFFEEMAGYWEVCSRQMDGICHVSGAKYVHLLQPNQYVPDSKRMTNYERAIAYYEGSNYGYKTAVEKGYPDLMTHGLALHRDGVNFVDLTMLFKDVQDAVYEDDCCHVNQRGNDLIAAKLAEAIAVLH